MENRLSVRTLGLATVSLLFAVPAMGQSISNPTKPLPLGTFSSDYSQSVENCTPTYHTTPPQDGTVTFPYGANSNKTGWWSPNAGTTVILNVGGTSEVVVNAHGFTFGGCDSPPNFNTNYWYGWNTAAGGVVGSFGLQAYMGDSPLPGLTTLAALSGVVGAQSGNLFDGGLKVSGMTNGSATAWFYAGRTPHCTTFGTPCFEIASLPFMIGNAQVADGSGNLYQAGITKYNTLYVDTTGLVNGASPGASGLVYMSNGLNSAPTFQAFSFCSSSCTLGNVTFADGGTWTNTGLTLGAASALGNHPLTGGNAITSNSSHGYKIASGSCGATAAVFLVDAAQTGGLGCHTTSSGNPSLIAQGVEALWASTTAVTFDLGFIATAAAPTVSASQIGYGSTTAANSNCGTLASSAGCVVINVAGTTRYIPYY